MKKEEELEKLLKNYLTKNKFFIRTEIWDKTYRINKIKNEQDSINDYMIEGYIKKAKVDFKDLGAFIKYIAVEGKHDLIVPFLLTKMDKYTSIKEVVNYLQFNKSLVVTLLCNKKILARLSDDEIVHYVNGIDSKNDKSLILDSYFSTPGFVKSVDVQVTLWKYINKIGMCTPERKKLFQKIEFEDVPLFETQENTSYSVVINKNVLAKINQNLAPSVILNNLISSLQRMKIQGVFNFTYEKHSDSTSISFIIDTPKKDFIIHYLNASVTQLLAQEHEEVIVDLTENSSFYNEQKAIYEKECLNNCIKNIKTKSNVMKL